ncbi:MULTISPECIES: hypothetical protein [unclassified Frankia]
MPTSAHETPPELLRLDPSLPDWVQTELLGDDAPAFDHARLYDPNVRPLVSRPDRRGHPQRRAAVPPVLYCCRRAPGR